MEKQNAAVTAAQVDAIVTCLQLSTHNPGYGNNPTGGPGRPRKAHFDFRFRDALELRDYISDIVNQRLSLVKAHMEQLKSELDDAELLLRFRRGEITAPTDDQLMSIGRALSALSR